MLILRISDILKADGLSMLAAMQDVAYSFRKFYNNQVILPQKIHLENPKNSGYVNIMPSIIEGEEGDIVGIKLISRNNNNLSKYNIPNANGIIILFDKDTKVPITMMDCQVISAMRTAAVSGYAARYLLNHNNIKNIVLIGAGVNMKTQVLGLLDTLKNAENIEVYSPNTSDKFIKSIKYLQLKITKSISIEQSVKKADLIISCTTNENGPLIKLEWLKEKVIIFNIGGRDLSAEDVIKFDLLISDDREMLISRNADSISEAYHKRILKKSRITNLNYIINSKKSYVFNKLYLATVGLGCHDLVVANRIYQYALENNLGENIDVFDKVNWI